MLPRPNRAIGYADTPLGLGPGTALCAVPGPTRGDVSQETMTMGGSA